MSLAATPVHGNVLGYRVHGGEVFLGVTCLCIRWV
jgi:hypothetical protein